MSNRRTSIPSATGLILLLGATLCTIQTGAAQVTTNTFNTSASSGGTTVGGSGFASTTSLSGSTIGTLAVTMPDGTSNGSAIVTQIDAGTLTLSGTTSISTGTTGTGVTTMPSIGTYAGTVSVVTIPPGGGTLISFHISSTADISVLQTLASQQARRFNAMTGMQAQRSVTGRTETASAFTGSDMLLGYTAQSGKGAADKAFSKVDQNATQPPSANATWRVWASQFGASETVARKASIFSPASSSHNWGMMTGFEAILSPSLVVGVAVGGLVAPYSIASHVAYGQATSGQSSLYSSLTIDRFLVSGALGYGLQHTKASNAISLSSTNKEVLTFKNTTDVFSGSLEAGYRQPQGAYTVMPFANIEPAILRQHGATRNSSAGSSSSFNILSYLSRETVVLPASIGLQIERAFPVTQEWSGQAELRSAWVHEFRPDRNFTYLYTDLPTSRFTTHNKVPDDNLARMSATLSFSRNKDLTLFGRFDTDQSPRLRSYTGQAGVKLAW